MTTQAGGAICRGRPPARPAARTPTISRASHAAVSGVRFLFRKDGLPCLKLHNRPSPLASSYFDDCYFFGVASDFCQAALFRRTCRPSVRSRVNAAGSLYGTVLIGNGRRFQPESVCGDHLRFALRYAVRGVVGSESLVEGALRLALGVARPGWRRSDGPRRRGQGDRRHVRGFGRVFVPRDAELSGCGGDQVLPPLRFADGGKVNRMREFPRESLSETRTNDDRL